MQIFNKTIISLLILSLFLLGAGCGQQTQLETPKTATTTPVVKKQPIQPDDPADKFCKDQGNELIIRFDSKTQSSQSFCRFPDTSECGAKDYLTGVCSPGQNLDMLIGEKKDIEEFTACDTDYEPVCGQDGLTYTNSCLAQIQGIIIKQKGSCINVKSPVITTGSDTTESQGGAETSPELTPTVDMSQPSWMGVVKDFILSSPPNNPKAFIEKCNLENNAYYFQSDGCSDCFGVLYNKDGYTVCYPNNDPNNECPKSFNIKNRYNCSQIWKDGR